MKGYCSKDKVLSGVADGSLSAIDFDWDLLENQGIDEKVFLYAANNHKKGILSNFYQSLYKTLFTKNLERLKRKIFLALKYNVHDSNGNNIINRILTYAYLNQLDIYDIHKIFTIPKFLESLYEKNKANESGFDLLNKYFNYEHKQDMQSRKQLLLNSLSSQVALKMKKMLLNYQITKNNAYLEKIEGLFEWGNVFHMFLGNITAQDNFLKLLSQSEGTRYLALKIISQYIDIVFEKFNPELVVEKVLSIAAVLSKPEYRDIYQEENSHGTFWHFFYNALKNKPLAGYFFEKLSEQSRHFNRNMNLKLDGASLLDIVFLNIQIENVLKSVISQILLRLNINEITQLCGYVVATQDINITNFFLHNLFVISQKYQDMLNIDLYRTVIGGISLSGLENQNEFIEKIYTLFEKKSKEVGVRSYLCDSLIKEYNQKANYLEIKNSPFHKIIDETKFLKYNVLNHEYEQLSVMMLDYLSYKNAEGYNYCDSEYLLNLLKSAHKKKVLKKISKQIYMKLFFLVHKIEGLHSYSDDFFKSLVDNKKVSFLKMIVMQGIADKDDVLVNSIVKKTNLLSRLGNEALIEVAYYSLKNSWLDIFKNSLKKGNADILEGVMQILIHPDTELSVLNRGVQVILSNILSSPSFKYNLIMMSIFLHQSELPLNIKKNILEEIDEVYEQANHKTKYQFLIGVLDKLKYNDSPVVEFLKTKFKGLLIQSQKDTFSNPELKKAFNNLFKLKTIKTEQQKKNYLFFIKNIIKFMGLRKNSGSIKEFNKLMIEARKRSKNPMLAINVCYNYYRQEVANLIYIMLHNNAKINDLDISKCLDSLELRKIFSIEEIKDVIRTSSSQSILENYVDLYDKLDTATKITNSDILELIVQYYDYDGYLKMKFPLYELYKFKLPDSVNVEQKKVFGETFVYSCSEYFQVKHLAGKLKQDEFEYVIVRQKINEKINYFLLNKRTFITGNFFQLKQSKSLDEVQFPGNAQLTKLIVPNVTALRLSYEFGQTLSMRSSTQRNFSFICKDLNKHARVSPMHRGALKSLNFSKI